MKPPARQHDQLSLRRRTIVGEKALAQSEAEGQLLLDAFDDPITRSYAAIGLMTAALDALQSEPSRQAAIDALRSTLASLEAS